MRLTRSGYRKEILPTPEMVSLFCERKQCDEERGKATSATYIAFLGHNEMVVLEFIFLLGNVYYCELSQRFGLGMRD